MKNRFLFLFALLCFGVHAQDTTLFQKRTYAVNDSVILPYRILYPENYNKHKKYPLLLFLHGAGERGNDNNRQLTHGANLFLKEEIRKKFPCFIILPQCPSESYWASVGVDRSKTPLALTFDYSKPSTVPLTLAIEIVKKVIAEEKVDRSRLYIAGLSMGGMGTFEAVYRYPDLFAAAVPICGGGDTARYDNRIKRTSFRVFHGDADGVVDVKYSRQMVEKLKALQADVTYKEYPGVNHNSWDNAFAEPDFFPWLFSHKRKKTRL